MLWNDSKKELVEQFKVLFLRVGPRSSLGQPNQSRADEELTQKINVAGTYFDIKALDHIILNSEGYYSFPAEGLCNPFLFGKHCLLIAAIQGRWIFTTEEKPI